MRKDAAFGKRKEHKNPGEEERGGAQHKVLDFSWGRRQNEKESVPWMSALEEIPMEKNDFLLYNEIIYHIPVSYTHLDVYKRQPWGAK